jgi:phospholipid/cholesterol/gamma-HCH transport system permease protein
MALASSPAGPLTSLLAPFGALGRRALGQTGSIGRQALFLTGGIARVVRRPWRLLSWVEQVHFIGNRSLVIVALTSSFTGLVLALQGYNALVRFGAEQMVGALVALSLTRELSPVLAALMVTARAGSAMAATLGTMRVTEQIDALETMAIDPVHYLVTPRLLGGLVSVPILTAFFTVTGLFVAQQFSGAVLGLDPAQFASSAIEAVEWADVSAGIYKSVVFAILIVWIATYRGFFAAGGALGVGRATTRAVVETSVLILAVDYVMTALLF